MNAILGVNAYHGDASACLVVDGRLVAAAEEERFRRIKHWAGFPSEAIQYCLRQGGITLGQLGHVAINRDPKANIWKKIAYSLAKRPDLDLVLSRIKNAREWASVEDQINERVGGGARFTGQVHHVEHHLAHLSSAFHVSPFAEAISISVDGFGDFASGAWATCAGSKIDVQGRVYFPHSLGIFYQALTQFLGFPHYGDEYKVMGLAPYGKPTHVEQLRRVVLLESDGAYKLNLDYFRHHREKVEYEWEDCSPTVGTIFSDALENLLGPARKEGEELTQRHRDIAHSVQAMYEEAFFHLLGPLHARHKIDGLALAGGCAMNSVANGKIYRRSPFKQVYVQSAAGDAGGALGAAFSVWHQTNPKTARSFVMDHACWGPSFSSADVEALVRAHKDSIAAQGCRVARVDDQKTLLETVARAIADGKVVGWFQGRMEWGPRALGNRSIVCDPRRANMKEILNAKIKRRESFRPFAPSIIREAVPEWFEEDDDVPFMTHVFQIREAKRPLIPAVTHVDGSGRLQTVTREGNPLYYKLIEAFGTITGVPLVLNTSFNENEPVVCRPEEALACFLRTKMDMLVLENHLFSREE